jgi:hypothetical protein
MRWPLALVVASVLFAGSCTRRIGEGVDDHFRPPPPRQAEVDLLEGADPDGIFGRVVGRLLTADDRGVLVWDTRGLYRVTWRAASRVTIVWGDTLEIDVSGAPTREDMLRARFLSEHPGGLTFEQEAELLRSARAADIVIIDAGPPSGGGEAPAHEGLGSDVAHAAPRAPVDSSLLRAAARAARAYRDRGRAIADGFVPVGPSFPGMGEHWAHAGRVTRNRFVPAEPPILTYVTIDDEPVLTGVAYALLLAPGDDVPAGPFPGAWHDHRGSVDEETLLLSPVHAPAAPDGRGRPRFAMVHAWTELDNPAGPYEQDNWALPFARLGLPVPATVTPAAGKALFLLAGGDAYYLDLVRRAGNPTATESAAVEEALAAQRERVAAAVAAHAGPDADGGERLTAALEAIWRSLWREIRTSVDRATWESVQPLSR